jgi:peptide deformylase
MLQIIQAPNSVLTQKAKKINKIDSAIQKIIKDMADTLINATDPEGVGLAAPQIGLPLQLFVIKEASKSPLRVFINPMILSFSQEQYPVSSMEKPIKASLASKRQTISEKKDIKLEGCLSLKDIWGIVHRSASVKVSYMDEKGLQQTKIFNGFLSTIIQHECDHLQGVLFPRRVLEQNEKLYKAITDDEGETVFEEMSI